MLLLVWANKYKYKVYKAIVKLLLAACCCSIYSCHPKKTVRTITPSFYYWKSEFAVTAFERSQLDLLHVKTLYIKFFDVDWDRDKQQPLPKAKISFKDSSYTHFAIIPTIFITNECIKTIDSAQIDTLAEKMIALYKQIIADNRIDSVQEVQFDCDWSSTTKDKYFLLLSRFKQLQPGVATSATIRLHQIKFMGKTGVPPVNRGLLMCYNMGNLKNPATQNSIIETAELQKYIGQLNNYPMPLDVALPLFDWQVLFRKNVYAGLIGNLPDSILEGPLFEKKGNRYRVMQNGLVGGYTLQKDDVLRNERSDYATIISTASAISRQLKNTSLRVSLYHLDSLILKKYSLHELETVFNSLR